MIVALPELLAEAHRRRTAVLAFSCYNAESAAGVLRAAAGRPIVILVSARLATGLAGELIVGALRGLAERASSAVCLQLDHAYDLDAIRIGCDAGVNAVMADGSHLPPQANARFVREARAVTAPLGIAVEAQLGRLRGGEESTPDLHAGELTDPEAARRFVGEAQPNFLGVAIGNVHGIAWGTPQLDIGRLRAIAATVDLPLVLHGGSALPSVAIKAAIGAGITKVNINTDIRQAYLARTDAEVPAAQEEAGLLRLHRAQIEAVEAVAAEKLSVLQASFCSAGTKLTTPPRPIRVAVGEQRGGTG